MTSQLPINNLRKKTKEQELEKGEVVPHKGAKQQKMAKDKRVSPADNRESQLKLRFTSNVFGLLN